METENLCTQKIPQQLHLEGLADFGSPQQKPKPQGSTQKNRDKKRYKEWYLKNRDKLKIYEAQRYKRNREAYLLRAKKYREENKSAIKEKSRAYYLKVKEAIRLYHMARYAAKREEIRIKQRAYWNANKDRLLEANRLRKRALSEEAKKLYRKKNTEWKQRNPERVAEKSAADRAKRRARISGNMREGNREMMAQFYKTAQRISRCTGIKHHVDHIVPLSAGGLHHESNLQILPAVINLRKWAHVAA